MDMFKRKLWPHIRSLKPSFMSRNPHFNFITIHYFWIIGMTLAGSICIYANGDMAYIDALFFGSGAATQSGLNTIDVNTIHTWQQVVLYLSSMGANPIVIHSFVVFLRLYWFEKRFQNIVREARRSRRSIAQTFSRSKTEERDISAEERGVKAEERIIGPQASGGKDSVLVHEKGSHNGSHGSIEAETDTLKAQLPEPDDSSSGLSTVTAVDEKMEMPVTTSVQFVDRVKRSNGLPDEHLRLPSQRDHQDHIAFVESQRKSDQGEVLRIPGPREYDAGVAPQSLSPGINRSFSQAGSTHSDEQISPTDGPSATQFDISRNTGAPDIKRRITIAEPAPLKGHLQEAVDDVHAAAVAAFGPYRSAKHFRNSKDADHHSFLSRARSKAPTLKGIKSVLTTERPEGSTYLSWEPTIGRNSAFVNLTEDQREELGGIEYRSLKSLALILVCYFWGFGIFAVISLLPWILRDKYHGEVVEAAGQNKIWWGFFTANTAFNDLGFTLTPDSMTSFQRAAWPLLSMSFLIIIGNTGFPIMLRFIIWVTSLWVPKESGMWEELRFLLDHPRRCFTLLFPSSATWWLFWILVLLNGIDLLFFIILDLGQAVITALPLHIRFLDGWFQAVCTRTAGLSVVNIAELHPAIQVSYLVMMYVSALPIAISVRKTNVYEERSLGIWGSAEDPEEADEQKTSYVGTHVRRQLSFDLWYIFLGFFIISIAEGSRLSGDDPAFNMFSVLFETVSAYGTVGLSLGYTNLNASFSAEFGTIAKLVIIAMQIRGRHRGLPYELDRAILLPNEHRQQMESRMDTANSHRGGSLHMAASKAKTLEKQHTNILSNLLHPGPQIQHRPPKNRRASAVSHASHTSNYGVNASSAVLRSGFMATDEVMDTRRRSAVYMRSSTDVAHASTMLGGVHLPPAAPEDKRNNTANEYT